MWTLGALGRAQWARSRPSGIPARCLVPTVILGSAGVQWARVGALMTALVLLLQGGAHEARPVAAYHAVGLPKLGNRPSPSGACAGPPVAPQKQCFTLFSVFLVPGPVPPPPSVGSSDMSVCGVGSLHVCVRCRQSTCPFAR